MNKKKVAFICVHNSCRSQIAEALGKHLASDIFESYSAGTETKPQINQDAVRVMKEIYGIDMEANGQYSKLIADIPDVDIAVSMGCNVGCPFIGRAFDDLQTMYEEIKLLWDQELKYRPNFSTVNGVVNIPVIFSKISGVKDGSVSQYWESIAALITEDTVVVKSAPYIEPTASGPMKAFAVEFYKNGKLLRNKIKNHPRYPYHLLREEMQEFILDKLQLLIERKLIKGIGENGTEYTVIAQILDLPKEILRLIQKFDFTKKNPKLIYINTGETMISLQDSILVTFLNLAGFDILFFVPTGYQSVENYFAEKLMEEHQIGEYKYDMQVPDLNNISTNSTRPSWRRKLFRRG